MARNKAERQANMAPTDDQKTDTETTANTDAGTGSTEGGAPASTEGQAPAATDPNPAPAAAATETKDRKSIVPAKYSSKYKDGGDSPTSKFIKQECVGKDGFEFPAFFNLCRINGIAEDKVKHYEGVIASKAHGGEGRTRMTLRNMLATIARKNGKLKKQDGTEQEVVEAKAPVSGAAAKAQETAAASQEATSTN